MHIFNITIIVLTLSLTIVLKVSCLLTITVVSDYTWKKNSTIYKIEKLSENIEAVIKKNRLTNDGNDSVGN